MIRVGTFTPSIIIAACRDLGYFSGELDDEHNLEVLEIPVKSSPEQFKSLSSDELDIAITSPDNAIAYRFLKNNPLKENFDVRILSAVDRGLGLSLARIDASRDPKREIIFGVDVPDSGFAFVGYSLLRKSGIKSYQIQSFGSTPKRLEALLAGRCDFTMLNAGNEIKGADGGAVLIASATELGPYLGTVTAVIGEPSNDVLRVTVALAKVIEEVCLGQHEELILKLAQTVLGLNVEQAKRHYILMIDPLHGLVRGETVDAASLDTLITLRNEFSPSMELGQIPSKYHELVPYHLG
jgi:hypothetical protein